MHMRPGSASHAGLRVCVKWRHEQGPQPAARTGRMHARLQMHAGHEQPSNAQGGYKPVVATMQVHADGYDCSHQMACNAMPGPAATHAACKKRERRMHDA